MSHKLEFSETFLNKISFFLVPFIFLSFALFAIMSSFRNSEFAFNELGEKSLSSTYIEKNEQIFVGKHLTVVRASIDRENVNIPKNSDGPLVLKGTVLINQDANSASYKWLLPEGVLVVEGQIEGALNPSSVGQRQSVEIVVKGFDQTDKKIITLVGEAKIQGQDYGGTAVISSNQEDSMEMLAPQMMEANREAARAAEGAQE